MPGQLPNRLSYLGGVIAELEKLDPDSFGDDHPAALQLVESLRLVRNSGDGA
jgi:hypothetical protein